MGRFKQVTRTVEYTEADIMVVNTETQKVESKTVTLSGTFTDVNKLLKVAGEEIAEPLKAVAINSSRVQEKTFCMPETMFIKNAMPLPIGKKSLTAKDFEEYYSQDFDEDEEEGEE